MCYIRLKVCLVIIKEALKRIIKQKGQLRNIASAENWTVEVVIASLNTWTLKTFVLAFSAKQRVEETNRWKQVGVFLVPKV